MFWSIFRFRAFNHSESEREISGAYGRDPFLQHCLGTNDLNLDAVASFRVVLDFGLRCAEYEAKFGEGEP